MQGNQRPERRIYGRRLGRPLRRGQRELMATLLPQFAVSLPAAKSLTAGPGGDLWLEIGFGDGEHLAIQAADHPEIQFIGCEPYVNGVAKLLRRVEREGLTNIRVFMDDARLLMDALEEASVGRGFLLFPDPWPKKRHHKRRFVSHDTLDQLARVLRDGAELRVATDDPGYCRWVLAHVTSHPDFRWRVSGPGDWRTRTADWPATRYERKALEDGARCVFLIFERQFRA